MEDSSRLGAAGTRVCADDAGRALGGRDADLDIVRRAGRPVTESDGPLSRLRRQSESLARAAKSGARTAQVRLPSHQEHAAASDCSIVGQSEAKGVKAMRLG